MAERKKISNLSLFCILLLGCVDPFEVPSSFSNAQILVVEGRIGDQETIIQLTRTSNLDGFSILPEVNAIIQIEDEQEVVIGQLAEIEPGTYHLNSNLTINEKYRVRIQTANQEIYYSDYTTLILTPPITSFEAKVDTVTFNLEILLSTEDPNNNTRYYLWDYNETYEYSARYKSLLQFDGTNLIKRSDENQINICWKTNYSTDILLQSSIQLEKDIISNKRIVSYKLNETDRFARTYSILVNQYALSPDEYEFWSLLERNNESPGTLFDPQPAQLSSNLQCISDPEKSVIGYVGASSKSQSRIFIEGKDLPRNLSTEISQCEVTEIGLWQSEAIQRILSRSNTVPLSFIPLGEVEGLAYSTRYCADCREQGGTTIKPSFWY